MPFLSPAKLLVILVVALVVLGPDKLPKVARQIGGLWSEFRKLRQRLESDVRGNFPDLPSTERISQAVRSPISFLDTLADSHAAEQSGGSAVDGTPLNGSAVNATAVNGTGVNGTGVNGSAGLDGGARPSTTSDRPAGTVQTVEPTEPRPPPAEPSPPVVHQVRQTGRDLPDDPGLN